MIIKNLTSKQQKVVVKEITGENRKYDIFLSPNGSTSLDLMVVVNPETYAGIIEIEGYTAEVVKEVKEIPVVKEVEAPVAPAVEIEKLEEEVVEEESHEETAESFICDVCGAEFASARGLATHKNKSHQ